MQTTRMTSVIAMKAVGRTALTLQTGNIFLINRSAAASI